MRKTVLIPWLITATLAGALLSACRQRPADGAAPAPVDTAATAPVPDTSVASPPITPPETSTPQDTPPSQSPSAAGKGPQVSQLEYEGWRQYSAQCARCHGQDALPNPVAANLLVSLGRGGPIDSPEKFDQVVSEGRTDRGMPSFKGVLSPPQIQAIYAYLKGRAEKRIPPGRPEKPKG